MCIGHAQVFQQKSSRRARQAELYQEKKGKREGEGREDGRPQVQPRLLPISYSEAMVIEEACRLFAVSEQQHADDSIQGEDGRALCADSVRDIECPEGILTDLKEAVSRQAQRKARGSRPHNRELLLQLGSVQAIKPLGTWA